MSTAQLSEAWCVLSRVSPTQEPVKRLLATIAKQEQELAEARKRITDLERCDEILHQDGERWRKIASDKHHEAEKAREQRDRLAEALRIIMEDQKTDPFIFELAQKALAAVEGGRSE
jgi:septal ring factor EnvC (AmiA/AmiB activator)